MFPFLCCVTSQLYPNFSLHLLDLVADFGSYFALLCEKNYFKIRDLYWGILEQKFFAKGYIFTDLSINILRKIHNCIYLLICNSRNTHVSII